MEKNHADKYLFWKGSLLQVYMFKMIDAPFKDYCNQRGMQNTYSFYQNVSSAFERRAPSPKLMTVSLQSPTQL